MPNRINEIVLTFAKQVKEILGDSLSKIIVYGSYARGDFNDRSDIDIMILVTLDGQQIKKIENDILDLAFDIDMEMGIEISPIIKNEEEYEYWVEDLPFYRNIRKEGVLIAG